MLRKIMLAVGLAATAASGGCYAYDGYYANADLAYVAPGVSVVTDSAYPVFYADNYYWLYDQGLWYRSPYYYGGWTYAVPPLSVRGIYHPGAYAHYHPYGRYYGHGYYGHGYYGHGYYGHGYYGRGYYYGGRGYYGHGYRSHGPVYTQRGTHYQGHGRHH